jgi:hypothetical protein
VDVKANGVLIAHGEVVVMDEHFGVRNMKVIAPAGSSGQPLDQSEQSSDQSKDESSQAEEG